MEFLQASMFNFWNISLRVGPLWTGCINACLTLLDQGVKP